MPSPTDATTSTSERRPSSSSSASRNTWLSSTRTIRIGTDTRSRLLGGEEQRIVRLPARVHVELELRVVVMQPREHAVELRLVGAGQQRQDAARLGQEPL